MSFKTNETIREVNGISDEQKKAIMNFLQGAVYLLV